MKSHSESVGRLVRSVSYPVRLRRRDSSFRQKDVETNIEKRPKRYIMTVINYTTFLCFFALIISAFFRLISMSKHYNQLYALSYIPIIIVGNAYATFGIKSLLSSLIQIVLPSHILHKNSLYYSCIPSTARVTALPPVVIQLPVHKEDFETVIVPTLNSVQTAIDHYKRKGGIAKVIVCDDALQLDDDIKIQRTSYYESKNISYIGRPKENRTGRFKKASNLNLCSNMSVKYGEMIFAHQSTESVWNDLRINHNIIGNGDITIPINSIILLIDSDTYVPKESLYKTALEFQGSPNLAYVQHCMSAFHEQKRNLWERMINYTTNRIYNQGIAFGTALGDLAPIVGHNVFLRWHAIKEVAKDGLIWSEDKVSEDFDLYIRLSAKDFMGRYATYAQDFQEGISLSYIDEIKKFTKFTFGACEMTINPLSSWFKHGIFSNTLKDLLYSRHIPLHAKLSTLYYLATYYSLSTAFYFILLESVLTILNPVIFARYLLRSIDVMYACLVTFACVPLITEFFLRMRLERRIPYRETLRQIGWIIPHGLFIVSTMFHTTYAAFCYFFGIEQSWSTTRKDGRDKSKWASLKETMNELRVMYMVLFPLTMGYLFASIWFKMTITESWGMLFYGFTHLLAPILMNPDIVPMK